ncbi:ribbon-helix-helix protein, CopG family [Candidatus Binatus sp.]|uniref:ribbon-helix-helix protein, CopG family n=1 Tax=Candidatus Binatus sp. TaxID=2811406 RepID=UPI00351D357A
MSIRLDAETTVSIERLAREKGKSKSEIVRDALRQYAKRDGVRSHHGETLYDRIKDIVGSCSGGDAALSVDTGRKYAEMLWEERRAKLARGRRPPNRAHRSR